MLSLPDSDNNRHEDTDDTCPTRDPRPEERANLAPFCFGVLFRQPILDIAPGKLPPKMPVLKPGTAAPLSVPPWINFIRTVSAPSASSSARCSSVNAISLQILLKNLRGVEGSLRSRFVCSEHNHGSRGRGSRSAYDAVATKRGRMCAAEARSVRVHKSAAIVSGEVGRAASHDTGAAASNGARHYWSFLQRTISKFEMRVASVECRLGGRSHGLWHRLTGEKKAPACVSMRTTFGANGIS